MNFLRYYRDFLEELKLEEEKEKIKEEIEIDDIKDITIIKEKGLTRFFKFLTYKLEDILKILMFISIFFILSVGATVLLNVELRNNLFMLLKQSLGL